MLWYITQTELGLLVITQDRGISVNVSLQQFAGTSRACWCKQSETSTKTSTSSSEKKITTTEKPILGIENGDLTITGILLCHNWTKMYTALWCPKKYWSNKEKTTSSSRNYFKSLPCLCAAR